MAEQSKPGNATSSDQVLAVRHEQGVIRLDDRGPDPLRVIYGEPLPYSGPIVGHTLRQGTPMASGDGQLCETPAAQAVRAASS